MLKKYFGCQLRLNYKLQRSFSVVEVDDKEWEKFKNDPSVKETSIKMEEWEKLQKGKNNFKYLKYLR